MYGLIEDKKFQIRMVLNSEMIADNLTKAHLTRSFNKYQGK